MTDIPEWRPGRPDRRKTPRSVTYKFAIVDPATGAVLRGRQCQEADVLRELPPTYPTGVQAVRLPIDADMRTVHITHRFDGDKLTPLAEANKNYDTIEEFGRTKRILR